MDSSVTLCADAVDQLDSAMGGLNDAVQELNDAISTSSDLLLSDLRAINNQFGKIIDVLRRQSDSTEETEEELLEDVSDQATETDEDAGRITNAKNTGAVEGDVNVAGIVGSMAIEYDYDPEDDLTTSGDRSLDFHYQAAALTEGCVNTGEVTGKKDYVGGIVGRMDLGTVSQCESYAPVESTGGDYVGASRGRPGPPSATAGPAAPWRATTTSAAWPAWARRSRTAAHWWRSTGAPPILVPCWAAPRRGERCRATSLPTIPSTASTG